MTLHISQIDLPDITFLTPESHLRACIRTKIEEHNYGNKINQKLGKKSSVSNYCHINKLSLISLKFCSFRYIRKFVVQLVLKLIPVSIPHKRNRNLTGKCAD